LHNRELVGEVTLDEGDDTVTSAVRVVTNASFRVGIAFLELRLPRRIVVILSVASAHAAYGTLVNGDDILDLQGLQHVWLKVHAMHTREFRTPERYF
jgi:hypothetical protein